MAEIVTPHIAHNYPHDLAWCGAKLIDHWLIGGDWRFNDIELAIKSAQQGGARPCAACVAAIQAALLQSL